MTGGREAARLLRIELPSSEQLRNVFELERQPLIVKKRGAGLQLIMQVRAIGVAGVSQFPDDLTGDDVVACLDRY